MDTLSYGLAKQFYDLVRDRGARCLLRRTIMTQGPAPLPSPPVVEDMVVDGAIAQGAVTLNLRASACRGILQPGDALAFNGAAYQVSNTVRSRSAAADFAGFDGVQVSQSIAATPDGAPVAVSCGSDVVTYAMINGFPRRLVDGNLIQASDLDVILPAYKISEPVPQTDRIVIAGREKTIVSVSPVYVRDIVVQWRAQAR